MTDPVERINLLEGPAFRREIAIQDADAAIQDLDTDVVRRVGGPDIALVPTAFLPHRAWGRSVDIYDPAWPEETRRAKIVAAPAEHEIKGTPAGIDLALATLGIDAVTTEWWQVEPKRQPYTFRVRANFRNRLYGGPELDARMIRIAFVTILRAKPLSRAFDLETAAATSAALGIGGRFRPRFRISLAAAPVLPAGVS